MSDKKRGRPPLSEEGQDKSKGTEIKITEKEIVKSKRGAETSSKQAILNAKHGAEHVREMTKPTGTISKTYICIGNMTDINGSHFPGDTFKSVKNKEIDQLIEMKIIKPYDEHLQELREMKENKMKENQVKIEVLEEEIKKLKEEL